MHFLNHLLALQFSGKIGFGAILTMCVVVCSTTALLLKWRQGDPSEWRENYLGELKKREEVERELREQKDASAAILQENAVMKARTDLAPVLTTLTALSKSLELLEENQQRTAELLARVADVLEVNGHHTTSSAETTVRVRRSS